MQENVIVPQPPQIDENYINVQLHIEFFYVDKTPFLHKKSGKQPCTSKVNHTFIADINNVKKIYRSRGFRIVFFHRDNEFNINLLKYKILPYDMKICVKDEYVHIVEMSIGTVKERSQCTIHSVPYTSFPIIMINSLFLGRVSSLNSFLPTNGISDTIIPATIAPGKCPR